MLRLTRRASGQGFVTPCDIRSFLFIGLPPQQACTQSDERGENREVLERGTTAQLWLNLQTDYDVQVAKRDLGKILDRIEAVNKPKAA